MANPNPNPPKVTMQGYNKEKRDFDFKVEVYDERTQHYFTTAENVTSDQAEDIRRGWLTNFWGKK
jgi:hypothetical protein